MVAQMNPRSRRIAAVQAVAPSDAAVGLREISRHIAVPVQCMLCLDKETRNERQAF